MPKSSGSSDKSKKRKSGMNVPKTIFLIGLLVAAIGFFMIEKRQDRVPQIAAASEKPVGLSAKTKEFIMLQEPADQLKQTSDSTEKTLQYAAVHVDRSGLKKVISVGSLEDCIALQNAGRTLNLEQGKNFFNTECIPY